MYRKGLLGLMVGALLLMPACQKAEEPEAGAPEEKVVQETVEPSSEEVLTEERTEEEAAPEETPVSSSEEEMPEEVKEDTSAPRGEDISAFLQGENKGLMEELNGQE